MSRPPAAWRVVALPVALAAGLAVGMVALGHTMGRAQTASPAPPSPTASPLSTPTAGASPSPSPSPSPSSAQEQAGKLIYLRDCAWCHGAEGEGSTFGPTLIGTGPASADFMLSTGRMPIPKVEVQPNRRPPAYARGQIDDLVAYIAALGVGPPIPPVDPAAGNLGEGADLYERNCAACHSSTGVGAALTSGLQAPTLRQSTPEEIGEAVRLGGAGLRSGKMPRFGPDVLSDRQLNSIIRYVQYLQRPNDRGGASLAHIGPVAEGFVAWFGALLFSLLLIRWIGERTRGG
jgi:ubiquinol-cytochrome c reductase cytochrome c subunit